MNTTDQDVHPDEAICAAQAVIMRLYGPQTTPQAARNLAIFVLDATDSHVRADERERVARDIEASIVSGPDRYKRTCRCLEGETCHPHACHNAMNRVTSRVQRAEAEDESGEGVWPVIQAGMFWDELDPEIRRDCASIARNGAPELRQDESVKAGAAS